MLEPEPEPEPVDEELPNQLSVVDRRIAQELRYRDNLWRSNYHEAAIFIEEGMNNDKFENHPRRQVAAINQQLADRQHHDYGTIKKPISAQEHEGSSPLLSDHSALNKKHNDSNQESKTDTKPDHEQESQTNDLYNHQASLSPRKPKYTNSNHYNYLLSGQFTTIETYILVHNRYFYQLDLIASLVLIFLALFEPPAVPGLEINTSVHAAVEMFALAIIAMELILKFRWMGPRRFFRHGRTVTKILVLSTMIIESIVIFSRQVGHARYSRALRPIFLIDNHYCNGIRRVVRQIFQAIPAIFDMFILAIFFLFVFSIFGFYLLASNNSYFSDMLTTVGNLLILATTANMPDIILPSYAISRWSAIYFVLFIIIHLFLLTNLTMAAVYESFTRREKEKFHKLFLHRRKACQEAFKLLVSLKNPNQIQYRQFMGLMRYLNRRYSMFEAYLIFKALDTDKSGTISLDEFYQIYDFLRLDWKLIYPEVNWYDQCDSLSWRVRNFIEMLNRVQRHRYFERIVDGIIAMAAIVQFLEATAFDWSKVLPPLKHHKHQIGNNYTTTYMSINVGPASLSSGMTEVTPDPISTSIFISFFIIETIWRLLALGFGEYLDSKWNRFDLWVLSLSLAGLISGFIGGPAFEWVIVLRILRLVRRFEFKRRYKDLWQTLTYILLKRFVSMVCVVMILYYFFAIIGMELMSDYKLIDCCKNTTNEVSFKYKRSMTTISSLYYLNDFTDIINSYMTLFSMTGSTFWLAIMNAYANVSKNEWLRLYFGLYYLCSIIVMNIVIAFILESFLFRIQYRSKMGDKCDDANLFTVRVTLSSSEVDFLYDNLKPSKEDKSFGLMSRAVRSRTIANNRHIENENNHNRNNNNNKTTKRGTAPMNHHEDKSSSIFNEAAQIEADLVHKKHQHQEDGPANERYRLLDLDSSPGRNRRKSRSQDRSSIISNGRVEGDQDERRSHDTRDPRRFGDRCYFIYQAEQTRNKFSFTTKMYADEVRLWLAEAERADKNALDLMISRNQIRAEQVALARLLRRNLATNETSSHSSGFEFWPGSGPRSRSYSSSGGSSSTVAANGAPKKSKLASPNANDERRAEDC